MALRRQAAKAVQHRAQTFAFHKFHGSVGDSADAVEFVYPADILVSDFSREKELVLEPVHHRLVRGDFRLQEFQGDSLARFAVARFVNVAHAAVPCLA